MHKIIPLIWISVSAAFPACAGGLRWTPEFGVSIPVGAAEDDWQAGYSLGISAVGLTGGAIDYGAGMEFSRWKPNAAEMLSVGGREMTVERSDGWRAAASISATGRYRPPALHSDWIRLQVELSGGVYYVRSADVAVQGYYPKGEVALNRRIDRPADTNITAGVSAGISATLFDRIQPRALYRHAFISGAPLSYITVGIGLYGR